MRIWPWTRFAREKAALDAYIDRTNRDVLHAASLHAKAVENAQQWAKRYKRIADQMHEKAAEFTETRIKNAELHGQLAASQQLLGRVETDLEALRGDHRQLIEKYNLAAQFAQQRQVHVPRDIFDEDLTQPSQFVDAPGASISDIHDKVETALSWRHGLAAKD